MIIPYKPKYVLSLLLAVLALAVFSLLFFKQIDSIVHISLYQYGLTFDNSWADPYWANSNLFLYCQTLTLILFGNAFALFFGYTRTRNSFSSIASSLLLCAGAGIDITSIYFLSKLDLIVNSDLYSYGLTFSNEWYSSYSLDFNLSLLLVILAGLFALVSAIIIYAGATRTKIKPVKLLNIILIANGTLALALSIVIASSILAIVGLGLLFWGITFAYAGTSENVKKILLETAVSSQMTAIGNTIKKLGFEGNPVYLPPRYFKDSNTYGIYLQKSGSILLPSPDVILSTEPNTLFASIDNTPAIIVAPPGVELVQLFEKTLETNFNRTDLKYLQQNLPRLIVEDLEVAEIFEMAIDRNIVRIRIAGSVFSNLKPQAEKPDVWSLFGSPLTSAIACSLARATGKPVMIAGPKTDRKGKSVTLQFVIL